MLTAMRPSSREVTAVRRPATPPATTAPTTASVATHTWCLCLHLTRQAGVLMDRFSTIQPVRSTFWVIMRQIFFSSRLWWWTLSVNLCVFQCPVVQRVYLSLWWALTLWRSCGRPREGQSFTRPVLRTIPRSSSVTTQHRCAPSLTSAVTAPTVWWWRHAVK